MSVGFFGGKTNHNCPAGILSSDTIVEKSRIIKIKNISRVEAFFGHIFWPRSYWDSSLGYNKEE
jgi:hypothetical protein